MSIIKRMLRQKAVYWPPKRVVADSNRIELDTDGRPVYDTPVQIKCRWEDVLELVRNDRGEEVMAKGKVFMSEDGEKKGLLKLGVINDLVSLDPYENQDVYEIMMFSKIPDIKAKNFLRIAYL